MTISLAPSTEQFKPEVPEKPSEQKARSRVADVLANGYKLTHEQRIAVRNLPWFSHQQKELDALDSKKFDLFVEKISQIFGKTIDWLPNIKLRPDRWLEIPDGPFFRALKETTRLPNVAARANKPKRPFFRRALKVEIVAVRQGTSKKGVHGFLVTEKIGKQEVEKFYQSNNLPDKARAFIGSSPIVPATDEMAKAA